MMIHHSVPHEKLSLFKTRSVSVGKPTMGRLENIQNFKINNLEIPVSRLTISRFSRHKNSVQTFI